MRQQRGGAGSFVHHRPLPQQAVQGARLPTASPGTSCPGCGCVGSCGRHLWGPGTAPSPGSVRSAASSCFPGHPLSRGRGLSPERAAAPPSAAPALALAGSSRPASPFRLHGSAPFAWMRMRWHQGHHPGVEDPDCGLGIWNLRSHTLCWRGVPAGGRHTVTTGHI